MTDKGRHQMSFEKNWDSDAESIRLREKKLSSRRRIPARQEESANPYKEFL